MKRALSVATATLGLVVTGAIAASPASASTAARDSCLQADAVCLWSSQNWEGSQFGTVSNPSAGCRNSLVAGHSVVNGDSYRVRFYALDNCSGAYFDISANNYSSNTGFAVLSFRVY